MKHYQWSIQCKYNAEVLKYNLCEHRCLNLLRGNITIIGYQVTQV